jgi:hypothetical protein
MLADGLRRALAMRDRTTARQVCASDAFNVAYADAATRIDRQLADV